MNDKQKEAVSAFLNGDNVFLTGPAGTGKSYTLKEVLIAANQKKLKVGVTATTGSAAHLIGGRTIHSFLSIGLGKGSAYALAANTKMKNKKAAKAIMELNVLFIDEISMLSAELLEKISDYLSILRNCPKPFGGLQVFFIGDFCQLPPVSQNGESTFCFKSRVWEQLKLKEIHLTESVRHQTDKIFQKVLDEVRWGRCSQETHDLILSFGSGIDSSSSSHDDVDKKTKDKKKKGKEKNKLKPTRLYPTNVDVDRINDRELNALIDAGVEARSYSTVYHHTNSKRWADSSKIAEIVTLCVGAQVVVTWNLNQALGVVNGTRGVVTSIKDGTQVSIALRDGREIAIPFVTVKDESKVSISYLPLRLAYALTIHRCQGMTLDCVEVDLGSSIFEFGQAYTALSRVRDAASVHVLDLNCESFRCHPDVLAFYKGRLASL
jgi:ATP-dependent DNA helicase PIF1